MITQCHLLQSLLYKTLEFFNFNKNKLSSNSISYYFLITFIVSAFHLFIITLNSVDKYKFSH